VGKIGGNSASLLLGMDAPGGSMNSGGRRN